MKAVDPHRHCLEPFFDLGQLALVELTSSGRIEKGSQVANTIDQQLRLRNVVFLGQTVEKHRRGIGPVTAVYVDFQQQLRLCIDRCVQPFLITINLDLFLIEDDPRRLRRRRVSLDLRSCVQFQTAP